MCNQEYCWSYCGSARSSRAISNNMVTLLCVFGFPPLARLPLHGKIPGGLSCRNVAIPQLISRRLKLEGKSKDADLRRNEFLNEYDAVTWRIALKKDARECSTPMVVA